MERGEFEHIIQEALTELPEEFKTALNNIAILIEEEPSPEHYQEAGIHPSSILFGLYQGVPLTKRGGALITMPDRITLFKGPIERARPDKDAVKQQIRDTVLHEIGHYFGMSEKVLRKLKY